MFENASYEYVILRSSKRPNLSQNRYKPFQGLCNASYIVKNKHICQPIGEILRYSQRQTHKHPFLLYNDFQSACTWRHDRIFLSEKLDNQGLDVEEEDMALRVRLVGTESVHHQRECSYLKKNNKFRNNRVDEQKKLEV